MTELNYDKIKLIVLSALSSFGGFMKKVLALILGVVVFTVLAVGFTACDNEPEVDPHEGLYGTYKLVSFESGGLQVRGNNVTVYAGAKIYHGCVIGNNCTIHAGAVIGADGFGFAPNEKGEFEKIPQIGNVILEDNVEVGANTCIDRATMGSTIIRKGAKIDNLIQIAHNVEVGENTVMAAQCGVAGSSKIGRNCMLGGQVGIAGHLNIANGTKFSAQAGVGNHIKAENLTYQGSPAFPILQFQRSYAHFKKLPEMNARIAGLQKDMETLKK